MAGGLAGYTAQMVKRKRQRERDEALARGAAEERTESLIDELRARELARRAPAAPADPSPEPAPAAEPSEVTERTPSA
jgi:hypothetical protein